MMLYRNQSSVACLPPVGVLWKWSAAVDSVGAGVLQRLEGAGLIERVAGDWWSATEELAGHLRRNHSVELTGSPGVGQRMLDVSSRPDVSRSGGSDSTTARETRGQQVTLAGDDADTRLRDESNIPSWDKQRIQDPAEVEGQMRLDEISKWLPAQQTSCDDQTVKNDETPRIIICRKCGDPRRPSDPNDDECEICLHCDQLHPGEIPMGDMPRTPANTKSIHEQVEEDLDGEFSSLFSTTSTEGED